MRTPWTHGPLLLPRRAWHNSAQPYDQGVAKGIGMLGERAHSFHGALAHARSLFAPNSQVASHGESTAVGGSEAALRTMVDNGSPSLIASAFVGHAAQVAELLKWLSACRSHPGPRAAACQILWPTSGTCLRKLSEAAGINTPVGRPRLTTSSTGTVRALEPRTPALASLALLEPFPALTH